jgi:2-haloacid dehalogenase
MAPAFEVTPTMDRRMFLAGAAALAGSGDRKGMAAAEEPRAGANHRPVIRAIAFDGFPIVDPTPIGTRAETMFPGQGGALLNAWRTRQFEYTWLRTLGGAYVDFWQVTREALVFAANSLGLRLADAGRDTLMQTYLQLKAYDDVRPALEVLGTAGIRMAFLSNFTAAMLDAAIGNSGLKGFFEEHLSTDRVRAFKPDRRAYQMGVEAFGVPRDQILFCAAAGWDVAGAKWFGYRTFWVNRARQPREELGPRADGEGTGMADLLKFVRTNAG